MSAATHENQEAPDSPPARAHAPWPFAPLLPLRALLRVETRAPSLRPIPARGQSCPQQRTKTKRPPDSPPARAHAPWPFAPLLPLRALLRVETRAPLFRPIPARGQSCPQQRTKTKRRPTAHQHARTRLGLSHPSCPFGRCCGLKPALRYSGQSRRADSLVRSNARKPGDARQPTNTLARALAFRTPFCAFGRCCGLKTVKTRAPSFRPIPELVRSNAWLDWGNLRKSTP